MLSAQFQQQISDLKIRIEDALQQTLQLQSWPAALKTAVEYSLLAGGKRLRPGLVLLATDVCDGSVEAALPAACSIEMIHTYSLIHDDLPCMDDDDLRRGRPTSHKVFGEALATLAGDALLTLAFENLATAQLSAEQTADCLKVLATAAGGSGMVGGQILDLEAERGPFTERGPFVPENTTKNSDGPAESARKSGSMPSSTADSQSGFADQSAKQTSSDANLRVEHLIQIHKMKTGALITAALELGAAVAGASIDHRRRLIEYGRCTGLAFQIADDVLDVTGSDVRLGKQTGRDDKLGKLTYPSLIGLEASRQKAQSLVAQACASLDVFDERADSLRELARFIVERDH
ncbi:MAG: polyprenyl synthetase family protein [Fuerstiella sp.]